MVVPNNTFVISPFYLTLTNVCAKIFNRDKLMESLIKEVFDFPEIKNVPRLKKGNFLIYAIDKMVNDNHRINRNGSIYEADFSLEYSKQHLESSRINRLKEHFEKIEDKNKNRVNFRVDKEIRELIENLAGKLPQGAVIENAVAHFLATCDEKLFQVINFSFRTEIQK